MKVLKIAGLVTLGLIIVLLAWGAIEPYFIDETNYTVALPNLPGDWSGMDVAVIADIQVGMWGANLSTVRRIVDQLIVQRPAVVLVLGDFIYHGGENAPERIETAVELLQPLTTARIPVVAVLGNHDYSAVNYESPDVDIERAERLAGSLREIGVKVLINESTTVEGPTGGPLHIVGIGSLMANQAEPDDALNTRQENGAHIVLMHNPTTFGRLPAYSAPLALAGHTHGGQIRLPLTPSWSWITFLREEEVHADGWIRDYGAEGNRLYVNRGIGFSMVPLRINCPPELTYLTLERAE